jgi:hypothetical protein
VHNGAGGDQDLVRPAGSHGLDDAGCDGISRRGDAQIDRSRQSKRERKARRTERNGFRGNGSSCGRNFAIERQIRFGRVFMTGGERREAVGFAPRSPVAASSSNEP